jgi:type III restriction enzyme
MNPLVNTIANRLSLRQPQRDSLDILARVSDLLDLKKRDDLVQAMAAIRGAFPTVPAFTDFERDFPSLCFGLATGVGKTRLMGAFIAYLVKAKGIRHFFVLAPSLTIYDKLIVDFTPNTPKYVFQGIADFAVKPPEIITGDNYESGRGVRNRGQLPYAGIDVDVHINIFNIAKITSTDLPAGAQRTNLPRFRRLHEYIGESYFDYLSRLEDLVLLMDESHRYRASAGMRAISELQPILGLELTATPQIERAGGPEVFKNVIYSYPLSQAMADGFVKEPAVATRENFDPKNFTPAQLEQLKLEDGVRIHENTKVELEVYGREHRLPIVKPFLLVVAQDVAHANELEARIESDAFFEGRYRGKVITVHSKLKGADGDETVQQLMHVEKADNPTEIVIHVNMLKEGWDVTNLYTIVPLRAANSRTLVEQSIGRGLRLPYGKRTGVMAVDRLTIVAHDRFQEIVDYANGPDSIIRGGMRVVYVGGERARAVTIDPVCAARISGAGTGAQWPLFATSGEQEAARATILVIQREFERLPRSTELTKPEIQQQIVERVQAIVTAAKGLLPGAVDAVDVSAIVAKTIAVHIELSIDIPRITIQPVGNVRRGYRDFLLDLSAARLQPVDSAILIQELHRRAQHKLMSGAGIVEETQPENYIVRGLVDFDDVDYDRDSKLLYQLAGQVVAHLRNYLANETEVTNVLQYHQQSLVNLVHVQMQSNFEEKGDQYEARVTKGFLRLQPRVVTAAADESERDFRAPVVDPQGIRKLLFGGFAKSLYPTVKFDSDSERRFAVILERDQAVLKWFRPSREDLRIHYRSDDVYVADFVVEMAIGKLVCEVKAADEISTTEVLGKAAAATQWCKHATRHAREHGGKPWTYLLVPHDAVADNKSIMGLIAQYGQAGEPGP